MPQYLTETLQAVDEARPRNIVAEGERARFGWPHRRHPARRDGRRRGPVGGPGLVYNRVMPTDPAEPEFLRHVFEQTEVLRKPLSGIITGYHVLPYILVGAEHDHPGRSVEVRGRIRVSPKLVIAPGRDGPTYGELFGESELMDRSLVLRVFSFRYASRVSLASEELRISRHERDPQGQLERVLEELAQREVINTGVIASPDVRFYPVSVDRFIREILDQEFRE